MILKELKLIGFGQFNNKVIKLEDGLNIIYGENETGKTTVHNFINGMFYGFLKPYAKRTIYMEEHSKYAPWDNSRYNGILKFTYDGKEYRIERNFAKNKETTNVFLDQTGEDITNKIDNGNSGKILQPGHHFFGFNNAVYSNTLSIKQLGNRTDGSLANEVRDKLANVSNTLDDNLSIDKAIAELNGASKDIGTARATTSPYGRSLIRLEKLNNRKESIEKDKDDYQDLLSDKDSYDNELNHKLDCLKQLESRLEDAKALAKYKLYREAKDIRDEVSSLEARVEDHRIYANLSMEDYSKGIGLKSQIANIDEKIDEYENTLLLIENKLRDLEKRKVEDNESLVYIEADFNNFEELEDQKDNLKYNDNKNSKQFLERDHKANVEAMKQLNSRSIIGGGLILISFGLRSISSYLFIIAIIGLILVIYSIVKSNKVNSQIRDIEDQIKEEEKKEKDRLKHIGSLEDSLNKILHKYGVGSKFELKRLYDKYHLESIDKERISDDIRENMANKKDLTQRIKDLNEKSQNNKEELENLLKNNSSKNLDEFKTGLVKKNIYQDTQREITTKTNLLTRILKEYDFESLEKEIQNHKNELSIIDESMTVDELKRQIAYIKEDINDIKIKLGRYEERIDSLNKGISKLVVIEEEIKRIDDKLKKMDEEREALDLAKSTIENISKDIHRQFAPAINKQVGGIIEDITGGRYRSVRIDNSLDIGVINPDTEGIIGIEDLSGGTIDQIFFALRFGIVDSINNKGLPLILDDCFIQYDGRRLRNIMDFLYKKSKERQIILFTCHQRENKILDEMKVKYNLITLSN